MLGCGGFYLIVFAILWASGPRILGIVSMGLLPLALLVTSVPHYGATLLRVYEQRDSRRKYAIFAVWATLVVWAAFVFGVYNISFGNLLVTIFLTWSPWHYSGQNYGIGLMLTGRGGVRVTPRAKQFIWLSFLLSWLLVVFASHGALPGANYTPTTSASLSGSVYRFVPIGIPVAIVIPLLVITAIGYAASLVGAFVLLRREASWGALAPLIGVVSLQGVWFSIPVIVRASSMLPDVLPLGVQYQEYTLLWIALGHSLQYLWVTTYFATTTGTDNRAGLYWTKAFLAGAALFAVPVFLFSPKALGVYSFESGLGVLIAAAVNLHHFILDGAIWKLRDGRIARILLRRGDDGATATSSPAWARTWIRKTLWGGIAVAGAAYAVFFAVGAWEMEYGLRRALDPPNVERLRTAARRLSWVGHDHPTVHLNLGVLAVRAGDLETAQREAQRSLELGPNVEAWMLLGMVRQDTKQWQQALEAYEAVLDLDPTYVPALGRTALVSVQLGDLDRAEQALENAVALAPERDDLRGRLAQVRQSKLAAARNTN